MQIKLCCHKWANHIKTCQTCNDPGQKLLDSEPRKVGNSRPSRKEPFARLKLHFVNIWIWLTLSDVVEVCGLKDLVDKSAEFAKDIFMFGCLGHVSCPRIITRCLDASFYSSSQLSLVPTVLSCLHVVWFGNMVNHHLELGKLASDEGYVLNGGRVALKKGVQIEK